MANTQALCNSWKLEIFSGVHNMTTDGMKAALYLATATVDKSTTIYSVTNEVSGTNYTAGGVVVTNATAPALDTDTVHWTPSASLTWSNVTLATAFDAVLIYNTTQTNKSVGVFTFGNQTVTAGNFTLNMPTNDGTTGLIRLT